MLFVCAVSYSPASRGLACPRSWKRGICMLLLFPSLSSFFFFFFGVENERACEISPLPHSPAPFAFLLPDALITADETACQ